MLSREDYFRYSLEVNLFFLRLAKEHAIFAAPALPPRDRNTSDQLVAMKNSFEGLLTTAVKLSNGVISPEVLASKELVTDLTLQSEAKTQFLTGIPINMNITKMEQALMPGSPGAPKPELIDQVAELNKQAILGAKAAIAFLEKLLAGVLSCKAASFIYPALIEHILEETRFFTKILTSLESRKDAEEINKLLLSELQLNWNEIMKEHAMAIRGYLDLSEVTLFKTADAFVNEFDKLPPTTPTIDPQTAIESQRAASNLRNFKTSLNHGMLNCAVKSLQPPLFYDHVTREANHYLRLLKTLTKK